MQVSFAQRNLLKNQGCMTYAKVWNSAPAAACESRECPFELLTRPASKKEQEFLDKGAVVLYLFSRSPS
jgi:hypothetical protein